MINHFSANFLLKKPLETQNPPCDARNEDGDDNGNEESVTALLHAVDEIHAEERGYQRGKHEDDGDRREGTHGGVHVVVDDAGIGVHRRFQDVRIDGGSLAGLRHLDVDVLDEVGVQLVHLQLELQFLQQRLVASDGGDEVGERVLQARKADEALVVDIVVQIVLGLLDEGADLLEPLQVPYGA